MPEPVHQTPQPPRSDRISSLDALIIPAKSGEAMVRRRQELRAEGKGTFVLLPGWDDPVEEE